MKKINLSDILGLFPTENLYRLIEVSKIEKNKNSYYLTLAFQILIGEFKEPFDSNELNTFKANKIEKKVINVAFARLFVIGSIWRNNKKKPLFLPNYLKSYSIVDDFLSQSEVSSGDISLYIKKEFIPKVFVKSEQNEYITVPRYAAIINYNLSLPLLDTLIDANKPEVTRISFDGMPWEDLEEPKEYHFVSFYSYEVYRYFFTGNGLTDLNERLLYMPILKDSLRDNEIYDVDNSVPQTEPISNPVYFKKHYDASSLTTIGNLIYQPKFKEQFSRTVNSLSSKAFVKFDEFKELPISKLSNIQFKAKRVKRISDNKWGFLVMQIESCSGYTDLKYLPVIPVPEYNNSSKNQNKRSGKPKKNEREDSTNVEPKVNQSGTSSMDSKPIEIEGFGLENLFNPKSDIENEPPLFEHFNKDGTKYFNNKKNNEEVRPPGANPDDKSGGRITIKVDPTDHFSLFPQIMKGVVLYLQNNKHSVSLSYMDEGMVFENDECILSDRKIKTITKPKGWLIYVAKLEINKGDGKVNYFLFARRKEKNIKIQGRNWIYSSNSIPKEEIIISAINHYLYHPSIKNEISDKVLWERMHQFNHLQSEKIILEDNSKTYTEVEIEKAIANHVGKLGEYICTNEKS